MAKVIKLTDDGLKKLEEELEYLKTEGRADIAEKIKVARGYGDLSENSEYDEAKNEQAKIEARIVEIEAMLKNVEIIEDVKGNAKSVMVGVKVKVLDEEYGAGIPRSRLDRGGSSERKNFGRIPCRKGAYRQKNRRYGYC